MGFKHGFVPALVIVALLSFFALAPQAARAESEAIAVAKLDYNWQISENARFTQLIAMEYGKTNTKTVSESALLTKINGSLQMKFAYNITHNSDVSIDKENTDTETSLTLVYSF